MDKQTKDIAEERIEELEKENERLKEELSAYTKGNFFLDLTVDDLKAKLEKKIQLIQQREDTIKNYFAKIIFLEAELEKRPEIIYCQDCDHNKYCERIIWFYSDMGNDDFRPVYCSLAKRAEEKEVSK